VERSALVDFSWDSRTLNKIIIASALRLPTSKPVGNWIDLGLKRCKILNFVLKIKEREENL
jgi:hypothetical protein